MISIIIPAYNEEAGIGLTVARLLAGEDAVRIAEIVVVDGGSTDDTVSRARAAGARVLQSPRKGRAVQMNQGAAAAQAPVLYFLHADSRPPDGFAADILRQVETGFSCGCYRLSFDHSHWFLKASCWFTRFNVNAVRFGDQSLFTTREVFRRAGGFNEQLLLLEDQEIIGRLRRHAKFRVMNKAVTTSARKYLDNGIYRLQSVFFLIYLMYKLGYPQHKLVKVYCSLIRTTP